LQYRNGGFLASSAARPRAFRRGNNPDVGLEYGRVSDGQNVQIAPELCFAAYYP
jgi:hypothetical protein